MVRSRRFLFTSLLAGAWAGMSAGFAPGQVPASAEPPELPFRLIAGRVFVRVDLKANGVTLPANLLFEAGASEPFRLHVNTAGLLKLEPGSGVDVEAGGQVFKDLDPRVSRIGFLEFLTAEHAQDLQEIPVSGILGWPPFREFRLEIDFKRSKLRLWPRRARSEAPVIPATPPPEPGAAAEGFPPVIDPGLARTVPMSVGGEACRFQVALPGGRSVSAALTTADHDTWIEGGLAAGLGHEAGDLPSALLGTIDLAKYVALRPREQDMPFGDQPALIIGTGFLAHFQAVLDPFEATLELKALRAPTFPQEDQACFRALAASDPKLLQEWCDKNKEHRLGNDAATVLLRLRLQAAPEAETLNAAVKHFGLNTPARRRARGLLKLLADTREDLPDHYALFRRTALDLALEHAGKDEDADAVHKTRSEIGAFLLEEGPDQQKEAYKHLLGAAFGLPRDGLVNLRLGILYERTGRPERAWSRFLQAAITEDGGPDGLAGLKRLADVQKITTPYDADEMERALEGRVPAFQPASSFKPKDGKKPSRVVLVELFTGAHCPPCAAADLACDGLTAHFAGGEAVVLEHHLPIPRPEPLVAPAARTRGEEAGIQGTPSILVDGDEGPRAGGNAEKAGAVFRSLRDAVEKRLAAPTPWRLELKGTLDGRKLAAEAFVVGPAVPGVKLRLFLCERTVLFPGANRIVLHRWVTREELTGRGHALPVTTEPRTFAKTVGFAAVGQALDEGLDELEAATGKEFPLRPTRIEERQVALVGWLEDRSGVLQAARWEAFPREAER